MREYKKQDIYEKSSGSTVNNHTASEAWIYIYIYTKKKYLLSQASCLSTYNAAHYHKVRRQNMRNLFTGFVIRM